MKPKPHTGARAFASLLLVVQLLAPAGVFAQGARRGAARGANAPAALAWPRPTSQSKPWARWWWLGNAVNRRDLSKALAEYEQAGLGGLELTPIYGVRGEESRFINFLSPEWVGMLEHTLREASRLGLGVDMATGTGWPFGGPWINAEDAAKDLVSKTWELRGGARLGEPVRAVQKPLVRAVGRRPNIQDLREPISSNPNLQELALDQVRFEKPLPLQALIARSDRGETVDLTSRVRADGTLDWVAPEGRWKIYGLFQGWHGKQVERAAPGGEGNVVDHFSAEALGHYLNRFQQAFAGRNVRGLRAFFNDSYEVDDAEGQSDWTPKFFEEFQTRRGYDLRPQLPTLLGEGDEETRDRVLHDFRETVSDLLRDRFTGTWREWAHRRGAIVRNQSHGSPANILDLYAASDIPETEGTDIVRMKFASSAANVTGKNLASAETVTWLDEHFVSSLGDVKRAVDLNFLGGINHVVYHGLAFSPADEPWPGRLFYAAVHFGPQMPDWKDFSTLNRYIARVQSFMQQGRADNDVLLYYPVHDMWMEPGKEGRLIHVGGGHDVGITQADAQTLLDAGYAFDLVSDKQLADVTYTNGGLRTGGLNYKVIVLPETRYVPVETFEKLTALARQGATVVVRKSLPSDVPGLGNLDARRAAFKRLLSQLNFDDTNTPGVRGASVGAGRFLLGDDLTKLLAHAGTRREAMVEQGLRFTRRAYAGGAYYFVLNRGNAPFKGWAPLASDARSVAVFDPLTGEAGLAVSRDGSGGGQEIYIQLAPGESCLLKTFDTRQSAQHFTYFQAAGAPQALGGEWSVNFVEGGPTLPPALRLNTPESWARLEGDAYKTFSGTARYTLDFKRPQGANTDWLLDLGRVAETARVRLNGQELGTLITPPFRVRIPSALLRDQNTLEVEVTNLAINRVIDLERRGVKYKKFYNTNFPARRPEDRGADGLFDATKLEPRDSGLLGPVTLTPAGPVSFGIGPATR
ncbi:MAG: glycoside hydrolase family 2 protein [Acidobacteria bacterium]|nr:glycoside hydrolase family 2 protein [Acidobacteriota bacterium]